MDLVDLIASKGFVGQDFLAWLWYRSEAGDGVVEVEGVGPVRILFEKHMLLEYGRGDEHERVVCRGLQTELVEARAGLAMGKKPSQARLRLAWRDQEFGLTLGAATFEMRNIRLPRTMETADDPADEAAREAAALTRLSLFEELEGVVLELFRQFVELRLSDGWEAEEAAIRAWVRQNGPSAG